MLLNLVIMKTTIILFLIMLIISCGDSLDIDTGKNTYHDDISDISYLYDSFFTTNFDLSDNAGDQIDLIKLSFNNQDEVYLQDKFDLGLNGQGYLTMTNDGQDLYLQSRFTQLIFKISSIGEISYSKYDSIGTHWLPSGIAYDTSKDSIIFLYRNQHYNNQYRLRLTSKDIANSSTRDETFMINNIDTTSHGVYCMAYAEPNLYVLAVQDGADVLITVDYEELTILNTEPIADSTVVGIEVMNNAIYLGYSDRRIDAFR